MGTQQGKCLAGVSGMTVRVVTGDCRQVLKTLPSESVHCVVSSPPYFNLRDYQIEGQIGLEPTPDAFVAEMVAVFREVRRVLRKDGTCWLNLGDSYAGGGNYRGINSEETLSAKQRSNGGARGVSQLLGAKNTPGCKPKDLIGIPWRVAFALQEDGWYLRQDIIWSKPNPMPESVTDRCTKAHEYLFLLSKSPRYYYDADAIAETSVRPGDVSTLGGAKALNGEILEGDPRFRNGAEQWGDTRNKRSVWTVTTQPFSEAHFATFPPALIEPCIKAGTSEKGCCARCGGPWVRQIERIAENHISRHDRQIATGGAITGGVGKNFPDVTTTTIGWSPSCSCDAPAIPCTVLDPFGGAGTTGLVADRLQRDAIIIELNPAYAAMARDRIHGETPLFAQVAAE
jgi:DNA modification methylase